MEFAAVDQLGELREFEWILSLDAPCNLVSKRQTPIVNRVMLEPPLSLSDPTVHPVSHEVLRIPDLYR
jgi:hypothetical protein